MRHKQPGAHLNDIQLLRTPGLFLFLNSSRSRSSSPDCLWGVVFSYKLGGYSPNAPQTFLPSEASHGYREEARQRKRRKGWLRRGPCHHHCRIRFRESQPVRYLYLFHYPAYHAFRMTFDVHDLDRVQRRLKQRHVQM